jgi:hypothetical protein
LHALKASSVISVVINVVNQPSAERSMDRGIYEVQAQLFKRRKFDFVKLAAIKTVASFMAELFAFFQIGSHPCGAARFFLQGSRAARKSDGRPLPIA